MRQGQLSASAIGQVVKLQGVARYAARLAWLQLASRDAYGPEREVFNSLQLSNHVSSASSWTGPLGQRHLASTQIDADSYVET